jgi:hypothetical protein
VIVAWTTVPKAPHSTDVQAAIFANMDTNTRKLQKGNLPPATDKRNCSIGSGLIGLI